MSDVFKKQTIRYLTPTGRRCGPETPGATRKVELSRKWYGTINGRAIPLCRDKVKSQQMLNKLLNDAAMRQHGLANPFEQHIKRPLADHLADYRRELEARNSAPRYVTCVISRLAALLAGCGFRLIADLSASRVADWLAHMRSKGRPRIALEPGKEAYTPKEAAALLGIKCASVGAVVRRHRLEATGQGKARRFPRATVEALQDRLCQGASVETANQYLTHLKSFVRWLVKDRRMGENPFAHVEAGNAAVDRRHDRRELTSDELRLLLAATRDSGRTFRGLTGPDRYALYATACGSGFRAGALASLTPDSFHLDGAPPTVTLSARRNKSRVLRVQPLPADLASLLRDYLTERPGDQPVWGGTWARDGKGAEMLRLDLEAAGIPYSVPGPDGPLYADFHALRHSYITALGRGGVDLRTAQELAGHSTPLLTARYSHRRLYDLAGAVEKLPQFLPDEPGAEALKATGTDGRIPDMASGGCSLVARTAGREGQPLASEGTEEGKGGRLLETTQPPAKQGVGHLQASPGIIRLKGG
jgi:excisionase family DNA binding protein